MSETNAVWRVRLFDGPMLEYGAGEVIVRFRSKKVSSLLAYLALRLGKRCAREEIACALWPEENDEKVLSNRLRFTLASLRRQLEPAGVAFGSVIDASIAGCVSLREDAVWCDVGEFEKALGEGEMAKASQLLRGPLMPGCYDEWIRPEQVRYELLREEINEAPQVPTAPTARSETASPAHRLPLYLTRFFGRQAELDEIQRAVSRDRLVTLSGPGGIGKTRLAVEVAMSCPKPCAFVALAELNDPTRIGELALGALGISSRRDASATEQLAGVLSERPPTLLILDNAEHLVESVAEFSVRILEAAPSLHLLVTSRHRLEVPGERVVVVHPLGAPVATADLQALSQHPSVALFLDRAKSVRPDFTLHAKTSDAVASICQRLDGVPLALELAAVRVTAQSPNQIAEALSANLMDLKSRQRGLSERHRSLRAALQGSYDLLEPNLQRFFCKLSVFEGGWSAAAAQAVTRIEGSETYLEELVVRSLVLVNPSDSGGAPRYSFLETMRQFAAEHLTEEEMSETCHLHAQFYLGLAAHAIEDDIRTFWPVDPEQENLIRAFIRRRDSRDELFWLALAGALEHAFVRGRHRTALRWIDEFSPQFDKIPDPETRIRVRYAACQILPDVGRLEGTQRMAAAMARDARTSGNDLGAVFADVVQGYVAEFSGHLHQAVALHSDALRRARLLGSRQLMETCLSHASGTLHDAALSEAPGSPTRQQMLLESESLARELIEIVPPFSRRRPLGPLLLGTALKFQGRKEEALAAYNQSQMYAIELGTTTDLMYAYVLGGETTFELGHVERAALLFGAFQALQERMGYSLDRAQFIRPTWISNLDANLRKALGNEKYEACLRAGAAANPRDLLEPSIQSR